MGILVPNYPTSVWAGLSENLLRQTRKDDILPDFRDWDRIVSEVIAIEKHVKYLGAFDYVIDLPETAGDGDIAIVRETKSIVAWDSFNKEWDTLISSGGSGEYVPLTRKINGHELSTDLILTPEDVGADPSGAASAVQGNLDTHTGNTSNPHSVSASQVGLGNLTNDAQVKRAEMGAANGVATLGSDSKIPIDELPALAIVDFLGEVATQVAMLALDGQKGDWCIRTDLNTVWIIVGDTPTELPSWRQLAYPASGLVMSVNGQTGAVVLTHTDVGAAAASHSHTASDLPSGSITESGVVQLTNTYNPTEEAKAITPKGVAAANPLTALGDMLYGGTSGVQTKLAGNTTTTRKFLSQVGNGSASAAPELVTLSALDMPSGYSGRNKLVNPNFQFWQNGTSYAGSAAYLCDQWFSSASGNATSSQVFVGANGAAYGLRWTTGADSSFGQIFQPLEMAEVIPLRGKTVTFSIYLSASSGFANRLSLVAYASSTTDARASVTTGIAQNFHTVSTTLARYSLTFTVPSDAVGLMVAVIPESIQASGVSATHAMAQLEIGSTATEFDVLPYAMELQRCQRFFEKSYDLAVGVGAANSELGWEHLYFVGLGAGNVGIKTPFKVIKRTIPTVTVFSTTTGASGYCRDQVAGADKTCTPMYTGQAGFIAVGFSLAAGCNMTFHWIVDARL